MAKKEKINLYKWFKNQDPEKIELKGTVSLTLNTYNIRGITKMFNLCVVTAADVNEEGEHDEGVQRPHKQKHSKEAIEYALGEASTLFEDSKKLFWGDIILSNRESKAITFKIGSKTYQELSQEELRKSLGKEVTIIIDFKKLKMQSILKEKNPDINRVDGNHRLKGFQNKYELSLQEIEKAKEDDDLQEKIKVYEGTLDKLDNLEIPYTLISGITVHEEDYIFEMVNGEVENIDTSLVAQKRYKRLGPSLLELGKEKIEDLCLFIAHELMKDGAALAGLVDQGGKKDAAQEKLGRAQPVRLNPLAGYIKKQLQNAPQFMDANLAPADVCKVVVAYWNEIRNVFPEMFEDVSGTKGVYILFQAIGWYGFGMLGGRFMDQAVMKDGTGFNFEKKLKILAKKIDMKRTNPEFANLSGFTGGKEVYNYFVDAVDDLEVTKITLMEELE